MDSGMNIEHDFTSWQVCIFNPDSGTYDEQVDSIPTAALAGIIALESTPNHKGRVYISECGSEILRLVRPEITM